MITELSHTGNDMIKSVFLQDTIKTNDYSKAAEQWKRILKVKQATIHVNCLDKTLRSNNEDKVYKIKLKCFTVGFINIFIWFLYQILLLLKRETRSNEK